MNINIVITSLGNGKDACLVLNGDGTHTILVNRNLCREKAIKAICHELDHIHGDDFYKNMHCDLIESMVHESNFIQLDDINFYYYVV